MEAARDAGVYERIRNPLIITDRRRPVVMVDGQRLPIAKLKHDERTVLPWKNSIERASSRWRQSASEAVSLLNG